jgi:hypothetical protein
MIQQIQWERCLSLSCSLSLSFRRDSTTFLIKVSMGQRTRTSRLRRLHLHLTMLKLLTCSKKEESILKMKNGTRSLQRTRRLPRVYRIHTSLTRCKGHVLCSQLWRRRRATPELATTTNAFKMTTSTITSSWEKKLRFRKLRNQLTSSGRTVPSPLRQEPLKDLLFTSSSF